VADCIRGVDLQDCKTGKLTAAMGLLGSCLSLAVFSRRFKHWVAVSQGDIKGRALHGLCPFLLTGLNGIQRGEMAVLV
jgi:hypothetical protein